MTILRVHLASVVLLCLAVGTSGRVSAQSAIGASASRTPGALALSAVKPSPSFLQDLRGALSDARPGMRLVGARIVGVANVGALTDDVAAALASEQDEFVAAEQLRALLLINTPSSLAAAEAYMTRATTRPTVVFARWLARTNPEQLVERLPALASRLAPADRELVFSDALFLAFSYRPSLRASTLKRLLDAAGPLWTWVIPHLFDPSRPATDHDLLLDALTSAKDEVRERAVWGVVAQLGEGADKRVGKKILDAALPRAADSTGTGTWESFGRELVGRFHLKRKTADQSPILATVGLAHLQDTLDLRDSPVLLPSETETLRTMLGARFLPDHEPRTGRTAPPPKPRPETMRTAPFVSDGFYADLANTAGCVAPGKGALFPLILTFESTGRPSKASIGGDPDTNCRDALAGLAQVTIADDGEVRKKDQRDWVLFPVGAVSGCTDTRPDVVKPLDNTAAADLPPKLLRQTPPRYTRAAMSAGIQGTVVSEGTITTSGCVRDLVFKNTLQNGLDVEAALSVLQWSFSPAVVDARPTNVRAQFELKFKIGVDR